MNIWSISNRGEAGMALCLAVYATVYAPKPAAAAQFSNRYLKPPFPMPELKAPVFPDAKFHISDYGAVADGKTKNTAAFAKAITACNRAGGGQVIVPPGT